MVDPRPVSTGVPCRTAPRVEPRPVSRGIRMSVRARCRCVKGTLQNAKAPARSHRRLRRQSGCQQTLRGKAPGLGRYAVDATGTQHYAQSQPSYVVAPGGGEHSIEREDRDTRLHISTRRRRTELLDTYAAPTRSTRPNYHAESTESQDCPNSDKYLVDNIKNEASRTIDARIAAIEGSLHRRKSAGKSRYQSVRGDGGRSPAIRVDRTKLPPCICPASVSPCRSSRC